METKVQRFGVLGCLGFRDSRGFMILRFRVYLNPQK